MKKTIFHTNELDDGVNELYSADLALYRSDPMPALQSPAGGADHFFKEFYRAEIFVKIRRILQDHSLITVYSKCFPKKQKPGRWNILEHASVLKISNLLMMHMHPQFHCCLISKGVMKQMTPNYY